MPAVRDVAIQPSLGILTCRLLVPHGLPIFTDHFQFVPIVPGVVQLGWVVELVRVHQLVVGSFAGIASAKFRRILQPGVELGVWLEPRRETGELQFEFALADFVVTCGRLRFGGRA
jgi:3-hydroxymyristoyl/3-hydroxydecanoyl-(acyl carrier protein) dehydratase